MQRAIDRSRTQDIRLGTRILSRPMSYVVCLVSCVLCFAPTFSAMCYTLSVGHLSPLRGGHTLLLITDLSGLGPDVNISFYDETGREVSACRKLLPLNGKIQIDVENYLQSIGTIVLRSSSKQIVGEYWQINEDGAILTLPLQSPGEEGRYFINCFRFPSCNSNLLILSDPNGSGPEVQMELYSRTGELVKIARKLLRPYGTLAFEVNEYVPWDVLGKVSIRSFRGSIVLHYRQLCGSKAIFATPARLPDKRLLIDRFCTGSGVTGNLVITDASAEGPAAKIQFLSNDGAELTEKLLLPNGIVSIEPADYLEIDQVENGIIQIDSEAEVIADYWEKNPQTVLYTPAVDAIGSDLFISYFSPFDKTQSLLSLLSVSQKPVKVRIKFYSDHGKELGGKELTLEPYKQVDELMDYYFDEAHLGTIIVRGANASLMATSHILDLENGRHLGRVQAHVIK